MIGTRSLRQLHPAIDLRDRWVVRRDRRRRDGGPVYGPATLPRTVAVWHARQAAGAICFWPPAHPADQRELARRTMRAKRHGEVLVTVLDRRGATCAISIENFGIPFSEVEQTRIRWILESLRPPGAFSGRIRSWAAVDVHAHGALLTSAQVRERDEFYPWLSTDRFEITLGALVATLAGDAEQQGWAA